MHLQQAEIVAADRVGRAIGRAIGITGLVLVVLAFDLCLTYVLGLFPWTRAVSATLLGFVVSPIRVAAGAVISTWPNCCSSWSSQRSSTGRPRSTTST